MITFLQATCSGSDKSIPKSVLQKHITGNLQPDNGAIYDKKPFKLVCEKGNFFSIPKFLINYKNYFQERNIHGVFVESQKVSHFVMVLIKMYF